MSTHTHNDPTTVLTELPINNTKEQLPNRLQDEVRDAINKMTREHQA